MFRYLVLSIILHLTVIFILGLVMSSFLPKGESSKLLLRVLDTKNKDKSLQGYFFADKKSELVQSKEILSKEISFSNSKEQDCQVSQNENVSTVVNGGDITPPVPSYVPKLTYPYEARVKKVEGTVVLKIIVSTNGDVISATIVEGSGSKILDENSLKFVKMIKFSPARDRNNNPISIEVNYKLHYVLR